MVFQSYALYPHMTVYDNMAFGLKLAEGRQGRDRHAGARGGRDPAAHAAARAPAQAALRRPAPARRHRPRDRARPEGVPVRRAAVEPRRGAARRRPASRSPSCTTSMADDDDLRHPRPGRGDDAGRPDRACCNAGRTSSRSARRWSSTTARTTCSSPASSARRDEPVEGRVESADAAGVKVALPGGGFAVTPVSGSSLHPRDRVTFGVRPEHLTFGGNGSGLKGRVEVVEELGESHFVYLRTADGALVTLRGSAGSPVKTGEEVSVAPAPARRTSSPPTAAPSRASTERAASRTLPFAASREAAEDSVTPRGRTPRCPPPRPRRWRRGRRRPSGARGGAGRRRARRRR